MGELAQLGDQGLPALLDAAVSPNRTVAEPARRQIDAMLVRWAARRSNPIDGKYLGVIDGLLARESQLTPSGRRWARRLTAAALRLAESTRGTIDPELVGRAESLFAVSHGLSEASDQPLPLKPIAAEPAPSKSAPNPVAAVQPPITPIVPPPLASPDTQPLPPEIPVDAAPLPAPTLVETQPVPPATTEPRLPAASGPSDLAWRRPPVRSNPTNDTQPEEDAKSPTAEANSLRSATPPEVAKLLTGNDSEKLRLVEESLAGRHENGAQLLFQLAKDPAPRVRASAISALGSSRNKQLTQAAWRLALTDEDPQVARLASELQKLLR